MAGSPGVPPGAPPPAADKSKAACDYMNESLAGLTKLKTAVCAGAGAGAGTPVTPPVDPAAAAAAQGLKDLLEPELTNIQKMNTSNKILQDLKFTVVGISVELSDPNTPANKIIVTDKVNTRDDLLAFITTNAAALGVDVAVALNGGRRGKRSARRGRRSSKGHKGGRSRKGGRRSRGCKGRKSRGRSNKSKGGAKMGKELKAWMKRQQKATGIPPISKATIAATKTNPQSTGSAQRSESSKHVAAQARGLNSSSS